MPGPVHSAAAIAEFCRGEERLVYARLRDSTPGTPPYFLIDGTARDKALRAWATAQLECLMPECTDRRLSIVNRSEHSGKRDGFSHRPGAGKHRPESLFHQQGKAVIQAWVAAQYPSVTVAEEASLGWRPGGGPERVADVLLTWPDGERIAVEVQYAPLTVHEWLTRHQSYLALGVTPLWLLDHHGHHFQHINASPRSRSTVPAPSVALSLLHRRMIEFGAGVMWLNPVDGTVGTPWTTATIQGDPRRFPVACHRDTAQAFLGIDPLSSCSLEPAGLVTPTLLLLTQEEGPYLAALTAQEERHRAAAAERAAAEEEAEAARRVAAAVAAERKTAWFASDLYARVVEEFGAVPPMLDATPGLEHQISSHPAHWHSLLYLELMHSARLGDRITYAMCFDVLTRHGIEQGRDRQAAVFKFLDLLASKHILRISRTSTRQGNKIRSITLAKRLEGPKQFAKREADRLRRLELEERISARRRHGDEGQRSTQPTTVARDGDGGQARRAAASSGVPDPPEGGWTYCRNRSCRLRLDPILGRVGYHVGCGPQEALPPALPRNATSASPDAPSPPATLF